jgi:hypothetical protein
MNIRKQLNVIGGIGEIRLFRSKEKQLNTTATQMPFLQKL